MWSALNRKILQTLHSYPGILGFVLEMLKSLLKVLNVERDWPALKPVFGKVPDVTIFRSFLLASLLISRGYWKSGYSEIWAGVLALTMSTQNIYFY